MKLWTNVVVVGGMIGAAVLLKKLVRSRRAAAILPSEDVPPTEDIGATVIPATDAGVGGDDVASDDMTAVAADSGLAEVDPQPISHVAGEGIDLDGDIAAHEDIAELRERVRAASEIASRHR